jgi:FtsZ-binding cell division protein ZapB
MSLDVFENLEQKINQALATIHELKNGQKESPQEKATLSGAQKQQIRQKIQEIVGWIDEYSDESHRGETDQ